MGVLFLKTLFLLLRGRPFFLNLGDRGLLVYRDWDERDAMGFEVGLRQNCDLERDLRIL